jgi:surface carbohydrate biosynthesis protein
MKYFISVIGFFIRIKFNFNNPKKSKIILFDDEIHGIMKNVLDDYKYFLLKSRVENITEIYLTKKIFKLFIKNFDGNIMTAYLLSVIEVVNPKIIITHIDNSLKFSDLAKKFHKKVHFLAIQNAYRAEIAEHKFRYKNKIVSVDYTKRYYLPNLLCFGKFEVDLYKKYKIKVKNFFIVGSLRLANFYYYLKNIKINFKKNKYDICLVAESYTGRNELFGKKNFEEKAVLLIKFVIKFCKIHNKKLVFPLKYSNKNSELTYFRKYLTSEEYSFLIKKSLKRKNDFSTYLTMSQSKVSVGIISTILSEMLAVGQKILSCNLTPTRLWDFPVNGICFIKNCNYKLFEKRLLKIYKMPKKNYFQKIKKNKNYLVDFKKNYSTIKKIKDKINYFLSL